MARERLRFLLTRPTLMRGGTQINGLLHLIICVASAKIISILIHCLSEFSQSTLFLPHKSGNLLDSPFGTFLTSVDY
jgi:hypothetical protein